MMRVKDWDIKLAHYLEQCKDKPFSWGEFDCCLFAADAVHIITGYDYAQPFRGKYTTALGAQRALKKYGQTDIKSTLNALLGTSKSCLNAARGDVCLVKTPQSTLAAGICFGGFYSVSEFGLHRYTIADVECVWGIN